jgi:ribosomal protein S18 acetylase RimI-like enzyme
MTLPVERSLMLKDIVRLESLHLPAVASVHLQAFPDSALTRLGREAVYRYYEWQLFGPHEHHFIGVFDQQSLVGFAIGGKSHGALAGFVRKNKWFLVRRVMLKPGLLLSQRGCGAVMAALRTLRRLRTQPKTPPPSPFDVRNSFGILAIAVGPTCQGKGIGCQMMMRVECIARQQQFTRMHLTVSTKNIRAIRFYEKLGWTRSNEGPVWTGLMVKSLA